MRSGRDILGNETRAEYGGVHVGSRVRTYSSKLRVRTQGPTGTVRSITLVKDGRWRAFVRWDASIAWEEQFEQYVDVNLLAVVREEKPT